MSTKRKYLRRRKSRNRSISRSKQRKCIRTRKNYKCIMKGG